MKEGLAVQEQARDAVFVRPDRDIAHPEVACRLVHGPADPFHPEVYVIEEGGVGRPELGIGDSQSEFFAHDAPHLRDDFVAVQHGRYDVPRPAPLRL